MSEWPMAYVALGLSLGLIMLLVVADRGLGMPLLERIGLAAFWPLFAGLAAWRVSYLGQDPAKVACFGAAGYLVIIAPSAGRPALIMSEALPAAVKDDPRLMKRSRITTVVFLLVVVIAAFILT